MTCPKSISVITLFPECVENVLQVGIPRKAVSLGQLGVQTFNPRDYPEDIHRTVDDRPFGGGPGMVMKVTPLRAALRHAREQHPGARVVYLTPQGRQFDQVLSGGEIAALAVIDAVARLLPGVLGHEDSASQDSFSADGLLDYPHYTRPQELDGVSVPNVLLSGDHQRIARWRREQALYRTWQRRPDLLKRAHLTDEDKQILARLGADVASLNN